jgi:predicted metalloprotease with PDZ domain
MADFFGDREARYRVFARRDPFEKSGGGTAAARSFMFGYSAATFQDVDGMQNLLAHEMVHNWPHMDDEPAGLATWYNEGCAEYYSVVLPWRAGLSSQADVLLQVSARAEKYYTNPMRALSNDALAALYWQDRRTQRVPYGRGFFYLANVDAAIRCASNGAFSLDDAVKEILRRRRSGGKPSPADWLEIVSGLLGRDARPEYEAMAAGTLVEPDPKVFGGALAVKKCRTVLSDTGEEADGYGFALRPDAER